MSDTGNVKTYQYIRHNRVQEYLDMGWKVASDLAGTHHGHWSVLMEAPSE